MLDQFSFSISPQIGAPKVSQEAFSPFRRHPFGDLLEVIFDRFTILFVKKRVLETPPFFLQDVKQFLGGPTWSLIEPARSKAMSAVFENPLEKSLKRV